jgi:hypothetical protein
MIVYVCLCVWCGYILKKNEWDYIDYIYALHHALYVRICVYTWCVCVCTLPQILVGRIFTYLHLLQLFSTQGVAAEALSCDLQIAF